ncbi:MAG TPA: hypothetical protein PKN45_09455 [Candidatus Limiplasma sp.]|nr:hypothetical protein [Candidatus Limiplasma sp.]
MDDVYQIILSDGVTISNLRLNGNNFVSNTPISATVFTGKLSPVTIRKNDVPEIHEHMELVQVTRMGSEYWFVLRDITEQELSQIKLRADVDFIAMMADVEL